ncbi:MAG: glucuronate isomerase, partial [Spirochaetes bacterium]|nr:glucuronate isomerase [Spirochaetota bacterium]
MRPFIHDDFLLETERARELYRDFAAPEPIIDYHCHLSPAEIAGDARYGTITDLWLGGDHYKWRAMRANGIDERYITGDAKPIEKFRAWAATVPKTLGNPLHHWTHLELARYFGITALLSPDTAEGIYRRCNDMLRDPSFSALSMVKRMRVEVICTTDDPADTLEHHTAFASGDHGLKLLPAWRPDRAMAVEEPGRFNQWADRLGDSCGRSIGSFGDFIGCLRERRDFFHAAGCRLADHGIATVDDDAPDEAAMAAVFRKVRAGDTPDTGETRAFRSGMLFLLSRMNHEAGWSQQYHIGVFRNTNSRMFARLGPDSGFDSIGDFRYGRALAGLLDRLDREGALARTILYPANPADNEMIATMIGSFQEGPAPGKMQFGSAWWFLDQREGMERQMRTLAAMGLLSRFVGMTTDSRSILSYCRHEYFRR